MAEDTLTITDNRTGETYEVPIRQGTYPEYGSYIRALDLREIKLSEDDFGLMTYDPGYTNTAHCRSEITFVQGDRGILRYRGYPIEQLAEEGSFLETAYLVLFGKLPTEAELEVWVDDVTHHTMLHKNVAQLMNAFQHDAHPMGMLVSTLGALSTFYPDSKEIFDEEARHLQMRRLIAKMPTLAAFAYRHRMGFPFTQPDNDLSYTGNFLNMMFKMTEVKYEPDPVLEKAIDILFVLHADHEQNCSAAIMRSIGSSRADPYSAIAGAAGALYGPLHGGANERVVRMLQRIGSVDDVPDFIDKVKSDEDVRLMGFGHRVYKNYDPRAKIIKEMTDEIFEVTGVNPLLEIALELERIALEDEYFVSRKLYPNVDFYSGIIYQAMGFPLDMFPVLFAIPRTAGWLAQWDEMVRDRDSRIARPRQIYTGSDAREYVPVEERSG